MSQINMCATYFLPSAIIPYMTPVIKRRPLPKMLLIPGHNIIGGRASLNNRKIKTISFSIRVLEKLRVCLKHI